MRTLLAIAIALAALEEARADRRDCEVVFVRAPAEVRHVIETWLEKEPRCSGTIELRVVETESGSLYLIAQRPDGRIHEREVPDAQSAGVLVASWVADDWTGTPPDDEAQPEPPPTPLPVTVNPFSLPPGETDVVMPAPPRSTGRWISLASGVTPQGVGARFELDLFGGRTSKWTFGFVVGGAKQVLDSSSYLGAEYLDAVDVRVLASAARTVQFGERWNLRWSIGAGPVYTKATVYNYPIGDPYPWPDDVMSTAESLSLALESGVTIARELGSEHNWAIAAGPLATIMTETLDSQGGGGNLRSNELELMFLVGARYRL